LPWVIGRYELHGQIASGGMASVHLGRLVGPGGFGRTVAIKRLHAKYAKDPDFVAMFLDEARLAARVQHPNVVPTIDIITTDGELFLVMEHVQGESLSRLIRAAIREAHGPIPLPVVSAILSGTLNGLHAAHDTKDERGKLLGIVHRDISPQNILVGVDGVPRVIDFGVAKAAGRVQTTQEGHIKGKLAYMAPEQLRQKGLDRTADLYAAAVVLWEALTLDRLFPGDNEAQIVAKVLAGRIPPPSELAPHISPELDAVTLRGLDRDPANRFATGREMASALESVVRPATPTEVGAWVASLAAEPLQRRVEQIAEFESKSDVTSGAKLFLAELASGPKLPGDDPRSASQVSRVGRASPEVPRSRPVLGLGALIAVGAAAIGGGVFAMRLSTSNAAAPEAATGSPSSAQSAPLAAPPATQAAESPSAPPASASVTPAQPVVATTAVVRTQKRPPPARSPPAAQATTSKECDPPYVIDSNGEKHYKRECF
jgi:serine/threonine protein kinase